jgi:RNA polymerase sigma-70 factor, ECF subfamily
MDMNAAARLEGPVSPPDEELVERVRAGEIALFELLMRRHNQRIYRAIRSYLRDEAEVEDAMQQAYLSAYAHLAQFDGNAQFSTWLVRIAIHEALGRLRKSQRLVVMADPPEEDPMPAGDRSTPDAVAEQRELLGFLERAVDRLPEIHRSVFVLREVEGLSTADCAHALGLSEDVVKTRLHRARLALRESLEAMAQEKAGALFEFHAPRCDRVVAGVLEALAQQRGS